MDADDLADRLIERFPGDRSEASVVSRQARDLAASGTHREDRGHPLTIDEVLAELEDAPEGSIAERWNWWLGALEAAYGGYRRFQVERWPSDTEE